MKKQQQTLRDEIATPQVNYEQLADDLSGIARLFGLFKRDQACRSCANVAQCMILEVLLQGQKEVSTLARFVGISTSAMSRLLDGLEENHCIVRQHDTRDRRCVLVSLTERGRQEAQDLQGLKVAYVEHILSLLPSQSREAIQYALAQVREAMETTDQQGVCCSDLVVTKK